MKHAAICALQNRDLRVGAQPHIKTADGAGQTGFKRRAAFFSHRPRATEMRRYNHFCRAIRLRLSAANKWPMLQ
jgi:hypothetical protein